MPFQLGDFILGHAIDVTAQRVREGRFHEVVHCVLDIDVLSFQVATLVFGADSTLRLNKFGQSENGIDWQIYQSIRAGGLEILLHSVLRNIADIGHRRSMLSALSSHCQRSSSIRCRRHLSLWCLRCRPRTWL
jgi:hypothetical protein